MSPLTHVVFDFFGTLVQYTDSRVEQGYERSHTVLLEEGARLTYEAFLQGWTQTFDAFDARADASLEEYSMTELCQDFLSRMLPSAANGALVERYRDTYLDEWNKGVQYIPGLGELLARLSARYRLVLVTNTHHAELVHAHLEAMAIRQHFGTIVTSVEHGKRKPSPCIFQRALLASEARPEAAVYVGDSYAADYVGALGAGLPCVLVRSTPHAGVPEAHRVSSILELAEHLAQRFPGSPPD